MRYLALILAVAATTYLTRVAGFALSGRAVPLVLDRFLVYVPVAVFAALITPDLGLGTPQMAPRLLGAAAAAFVVLRTRQLWAGLALGMAAYWLARAALG
jgi:branched-subunit amino acid transport protein